MTSPAGQSLNNDGQILCTYFTCHPVKTMTHYLNLEGNYENILKPNDCATLHKLYKLWQTLCWSKSLSCTHVIIFCLVCHGKSLHNCTNKCIITVFLHLVPQIFSLLTINLHKNSLWSDISILVNSIDFLKGYVNDNTIY